MSKELANQVRTALQYQLVHAILGNEKIAREHGLLVTDLQALHLLVLREDIRTPRQISEATGAPTSTVTKLLDRLEDAGYLRRSPDAHDRRKTRIELISDAITPLYNFYGRADAEFDAVSREFTNAELEIVIRYLNAVSNFYALKFDWPPPSHQEPRSSLPQITDS